jgi:hypothetical protein|tara:strand:+ start:170 stop:937 length:768 start_codon:yes stop_codon:yes gene_type:complete
VCIDANAGQRAAARERAAQKDAIFAQEGLKFFNRETTLKRSQNLNILGYSRDLSDARASALAQIGQGRQQVEDATRAYLTSKAVNEGGRSRRFGLKNYKQLLSKRQEVDSVINNILGRNLAYVQEQSKRKFQVAQAQAREALGIPAAYGAPVMLPPTNRLGGALSLISNVVGIASGISSIMNPPTSDIKLKENIEQVGVSPDGHKIYEFNYIGFKDRWRGAMAQDVVKINPMAVEIHNGHLTVDYSKIDVNMELV